MGFSFITSYMGISGTRHGIRRINGDKKSKTLGWAKISFKARQSGRQPQFSDVLGLDLFEDGNNFPHAGELMLGCFQAQLAFSYLARVNRLAQSKLAFSAFD
jgi:hypothetical protein